MDEDIVLLGKPRTRPGPKCPRKVKTDSGVGSSFSSLPMISSQITSHIYVIHSLPSSRDNFPWPCETEVPFFLDFCVP